jgi:hypothetical protein
MFEILFFNKNIKFDARFLKIGVDFLDVRKILINKHTILKLLQ